VKGENLQGLATKAGTIITPDALKTSQYPAAWRL
jgi:hypothetical protein